MNTKIYPTELLVYKEFYLPVQVRLIENEKGLSLDLSFGKRPIRNWAPLEGTNSWMYIFYDTDQILLKRPNEDNLATVLINPKNPLYAKDSYKQTYLKFEEDFLVSRDPHLTFELKTEKPSPSPDDISIGIKMYEFAAYAGGYLLKGSVI